MSRTPPATKRSALKSAIGAGAVALVASVLCAGPAWADPIGEVLANGQIMTQGGANQLIQPSDITFSGNVLTIQNPVTGTEDTITDILGTLNSSTVSIVNITGGFDACNWTSPPHVSFECDPGIGIGSGSDISYQFTFSQPFTGGLGQVDVVFDFGQNPACLEQKSGSQAATAPDNKVASKPGPVVDDKDCNPPGNVKLLGAHINHQARTATFHFQAKGATKYECELFKGRSPMYRHSCGDIKSYANPMSPGSYTFLAWGVDKAGVSAHPAQKKFTI